MRRAKCSVYRWAISVLSDDEIRSFDVSTVSADSPVGFVLEVDLKYPLGLHEWHNAYPLAPEHVEIVDDMISPTLRDMLQETDTRHVPASKLVSNLRDKTRYMTHYRCLQFYLAQGLELIRIHRIVAFDQPPFMTPFIEYCNDQRKKATIDFEYGLYKLFANSFYGKTVENVRKRMNAKLVTDPQKMVRAAGKATFKRCENINSDLVLVESERTKITLNKPVAIGFTILEFAKLVMYEFHYDCLLPKFGNKLHLCFTDTDSFICHIETPHLFADMANISGWFDTFNFRENHFFSATNKRVLAKFKSETGDCLPQEFCGLRSKMYSLLTPSTDTSLSFVKAKGVPKCYVKKNVRHEQ